MLGCENINGSTCKKLVAGNWHCNPVHYNHQNDIFCVNFAPFWTYVYSGNMYSPEKSEKVSNIGVALNGH